MAATGWFRKNQKKLLGTLVVFLMVIWGIGPAAEYIVPKPAIGNIHGEEITQEQFADTAARWARIFLRNSEEPVAETVWRQMALFIQAEKMGVFVTKEELAQEIRNFFPVDPRLFEDKEAFRLMLGSAYRLTEHQFEKTIKEYLLIRKLQYLLRNSVKVTRDEALQRYIKENEKVKIKYAALNAGDFISSVKVEEDEIRSFYDKHSDAFPDAAAGIWGYKEPEKVKIEYVITKNTEVEREINTGITDEEMRNYYEEKKDLMFRKEVEEEETTDEGSVIEFKPFKEVKEQIKNNIFIKKYEATLNKQIAGADEEIYEMIDNDGSISFPDLAEKYGLKYVIPTNTKNGTKYFARDELFQVMIDPPQFPQQVFERDVNDPSPPLSSVEGKLIFRVIEKVEPHTPPYEEVREKVTGDLSYEKALAAAEKLAEKCLEKINQTSFEEGIKSIKGEAGKLEITGTKYITRPGIISKDDDVEVLGPEKAKIVETVFGLKVGESAIAVEDKGVKKCYVVTLVERKTVDLKGFEEEKDSIMEQYLREKQLTFLTEWESWLGKKARLGKSKG